MNYRAFINAILANKDIDDAMRVMDKFLDAHISYTTPEELDDFCSYIDLHKGDFYNGT